MSLNINQYKKYVYNAQGFITIIEPFTEIFRETFIDSNVMVPQKVCGEKFPISKNGQTTYPYCDAGYFCMNGSCKTFDERQDYNNYDAPTCMYSGAGVNPGENGEICSFALSRSDKCGPKNDNAQCNPGMFCNNDGKCGFDESYATPGMNCTLYSGQGIKDCKRKETTNNKCGPQNDYRKCSAGEFCTQQGQCSTQTKDNSTNCMIYSGEGISNCSLSINNDILKTNTQNINNSSVKTSSQLQKSASSVDISPSSQSSQRSFTISSNGKCGKNNQMCSPYQFCNDDGKCSYKPKISKKKYCGLYSGINIKDCVSPVTIFDGKEFNKNIPGNMYDTVDTEALSLEDCVQEFLDEKDTWKSFMYNPNTGCQLSSIPGNIARTRQKNKKGSFYGYI